MKSNYERVNHPPHYGGDTAYETIKVIEAWDCCFHTGNVIKYVSRAGKKASSNRLEDLYKARWYLDRKIKQIESIIKEKTNVDNCKRV